MRQFALTLAALGVLGVASNQAEAGGALSYPMAAHAGAQHAVYHPGQHPGVARYHEVGHYRHQYYGYYGHHGYYGHGGCGSVGVYPYVPRYPAVVVPYGRSYYRGPYYYRPYSGFSYYGPGLSIGIGW